MNLCGDNEQYFDTPNNFTKGNIIVDISILSQNICEFAKCKRCSKALSIELFEDVGKRKGIVSQLKLVCKHCNAKKLFMSSKVTASNCFENNLRLVYASRCIGKGRAAAHMFCSIMNLPPPPVRFNRYDKQLHDCIREVAKEFMSNAVREAIIENEGNNQLSVVFDGSWQKRGYTSLNGDVTASSLDTGKVIDVLCMSKYCFICKGQDIFNHEGCQANYKGNSGSMEISGVTEIYKRSNAPSNPAQYTNFLGDGDSKSFEVIKGKKPYGHAVVIKKMECIGHI